MCQSLKIAVADDEPDVLEFYEVVLSDMGHDVICSARNGRELVDHCAMLRPDLVIVDVKMPQFDGIDAIRDISKDKPIPAIVVSGYHDPETLRRAEEDHVLAYLIKPIREVDLLATIGIVMRQFEESTALRVEVTDMRQALDDQKAVGQAVRFLMKRGLDQIKAVDRLRELARAQGCTLAEMARSVTTVRETSAGS